MRKSILFIIAALALFALACGERKAMPEKNSAKQKQEMPSEPPVEADARQRRKNFACSSIRAQSGV